MIDFAVKLKALRDTKGWSQEELAQRVGMSRSAIGNYEQGIRRPDFEALETFADAFNVPIGYLIEDDKVISPETMIVFDVLKDSKTRERLLSYAQFLTSQKGDD